MSDATEHPEPNEDRKPHPENTPQPVTESKDVYEELKQRFSREPDNLRRARDLITESEQFASLRATMQRLTSENNRLPKVEAGQLHNLTARPMEFTPDDSPERTAKHTETMADSMSNLVDLTNLLANLTEANLNASKDADRRNLWLTIGSLVLTAASAAAAITSVVLFINSTS